MFLKLCLLDMGNVEVLWFSFKSGGLGGSLICGSGYGRTSLEYHLGFNGCLEVTGVKGMCSFCDVEPMLA